MLALRRLERLEKAAFNEWPASQVLEKTLAWRDRALATFDEIFGASNDFSRELKELFSWVVRRDAPPSRQPSARLNRLVATNAGTGITRIGLTASLPKQFEATRCRTTLAQGAEIVLAAKLALRRPDKGG